MLSADALRTCQSWPEFQTRLTTLSDKEKGDAFELLVVLALELHPFYATKLEKVWLHSAVPFEVREHLGIPLKDYGIDIVALTFEGDYWAVQAKYRGERDASLTHEELATFMSLTFGVSARFAYGLVCTTTDRVTHLLEANARVGFCKADFWASLDEEFFACLNARLAGHRQIPNAKTPRPDQRDVVAAAALHFVDAGETRGKFISPCGSGKTLTAWWIAGALNARRIIIAVPSLFLVSQTLSVWLREALAGGLRVNWLCVCSDESAGKAERDELVTYVHDLGIPCVTDPARIMTEMRKMNAAREIILTTYQSSPSLAQAAKALGWQCDLAVFDEAHKTVSTRRSRFTHLLFDDHLPIARRLFMTATERRFKGTTDEVVSMDDPKLYGSTFHLLSFKEALERGILCDYEILTIGVREGEVRKLIEERRFITPSRGEFNAMTANAFASLIALRRAVEKFGVSHAVSFHTSIRRAAEFQQLSQEFNQAFPEQPAIRSFHIAGTMRSTERDSILRNFAARPPSLVTNARCLTEGVDVPGIDCVMFVDPKASTVDIVQAAGRAMRRADDKGKTKAYIVLPFVVREGASIDDAAKSADFGFVVAVLRALASQDERIIDELRAIQRGQPTRTGRVLNFDMSAIVPEEVNADEFVQGIELQCWGKLRRLAWMTYEEASDFVQSIGVLSQKQWKAWRAGHRPDLPTPPAEMPASPHDAYAGRGWTTWGAFFGTGNESTKYIVHLPFEEARSIVRQVGLKSPNEWFLYSVGRLPGQPRRPHNIPSRPHDSYGDAWISWPDFLGYEPKLNRRWLPFLEARSFARSLKLPGQKAWKRYSAGRMPHLPQLPKNIPTAPDSVYAENGWVNYGDWLGTGNTKFRRVTPREFHAAREFARSLRLSKPSEWKQFSSRKLPCIQKRPLDIPSEPQKTYAGKGWVGWDDWLGRPSSQSAAV